jgi:hypothetical protein
MAKKCVRCKRRQSIMVDEPLVMPLCGHCHDEIGLGIRVGRTVCDPEAWPDYTGRVKRFDGDIAMHQPEWPFEYDIAGVVSSRDIRDGEPDEDEDEDESFTPQGDADEVVYICEGRQLGYGSKTAWAAL